MSNEIIQRQQEQHCLTKTTTATPTLSAVQQAQATLLRKLINFQGYTMPAQTYIYFVCVFICTQTCVQNESHTQKCSSKYMCFKTIKNHKHADHSIPTFRPVARVVHGVRFMGAPCAKAQLFKKQNKHVCQMVSLQCF